MSSEFSIQFLHIGKLFPVVEVTLVASVAALHLAVVPGCPGRDQLMGDLSGGQSFLEGAQFLITDEAISKLCAIVRLHGPDREREGLEQPFQEIHRVFRRVFFIAVYEPKTGTLVDSGPLVQMLSIPLGRTLQAMIGDLFYINLHLFSRFYQLWIPPCFPSRPLPLLPPAQAQPGRRMVHPSKAAGISMRLP